MPLTFGRWHGAWPLLCRVHDGPKHYPLEPDQAARRHQDVEREMRIAAATNMRDAEGPAGHRIRGWS